MAFTDIYVWKGKKKTAKEVRHGLRRHADGGASGGTLYKNVWWEKQKRQRGDEESCQWLDNSSGFVINKKLELTCYYFLFAMSDRGSKFTVSVDSDPDLDWQSGPEKKKVSH